MFNKCLNNIYKYIILNDFDNKFKLRMFNDEYIYFCVA